VVACLALAFFGSACQVLVAKGLALQLVLQSRSNMLLSIVFFAAMFMAAAMLMNTTEALIKHA
jgi:hypothetical protein